jgi:hypothetical protein
MIPVKPIFYIILLLLSSMVQAQDLSGRWTGYLIQDGAIDTFLYQIDMDQHGDAITGISESFSSTANQSASFQCSGVWDGQELIFQEIKQINPSSPQWCLKYATLKLSVQSDEDVLSGPWKATGCTPGSIRLSRSKTTISETFEREVVPSLQGKWTGTLSQSDRDYGFYFEMDIDDQGMGRSYIVSEGNGGSATHQLQWTTDNGSSIQFEEQEILRKSDGQWKWCIKSGTLNFRREGSRLILEGNWEGYLEGMDMESGACASGRLDLEKPVLTETITRQKELIEKPYELDNQRTVKIERMLEVSRPNIKIKIWDNGTVDGDVATLFLNGECILKDYRVSKRKIGIPVTLQQEANFLILHAEDLGDISPNTVAVSVDDGEKEQIIILSSNLAESGAVMIRQFKLD